MANVCKTGLDEGKYGPRMFVTPSARAHMRSIVALRLRVVQRHRRQWFAKSGTVSVTAREVGPLQIRGPLTVTLCMRTRLTWTISTIVQQLTEAA